MKTILASLILMISTIAFGDSVANIEFDSLNKATSEFKTQRSSSKENISFSKTQK
jgi:hypothetical protein